MQCGCDDDACGGGRRWQANSMDPSDNGVTQAMRYKDVPTALSYTLIHLSGDYPLLDYSLTGKFICFLMCLFAASVVQVSLPSPPPLGCMRGCAQQCGQGRLVGQGCLVEHRSWERRAADASTRHLLAYGGSGLVPPRAARSAWVVASHLQTCVSCHLSRHGRRFDAGVGGRSRRASSLTVSRTRRSRPANKRA